MSPVVVPARGMRDILPQPFERRRRILEIIRNTYAEHGFTQIETPAMEPIERLTSGQGGDNESMLFEVQKRGLDPQEPILPKQAIDSALRYDLTVPLTRFYASHQAELPSVFRAFQTGPVWRAERPQKGRYRQFAQCDIDIIGESSHLAEIELMSASWEALTRLGLAKDSTLRLNDRRILADLLNDAGIPENLHARTLIAVDKLDKIGMQGVSQELVEKVGLDPHNVRALTEKLEKLGTQTPLSQVQEVNLYDLQEISEALLEEYPEARVVFDPTLVRGMGYYTATIAEVAHTASGSSVAGGGRYDGVVGKWLGKDVPAAGFSIGFERIVDLVELDENPQPRLALLYAKTENPSNVARQRRKLALELSAEEKEHRTGESQSLYKSVVVPVVTPKKLSGAFFERLRSEGYTHTLKLGENPSEAKALSES